MAIVDSTATHRETWHRLVTGEALDASQEAALRAMVGPDRNRPGPDRWRLVQENLPIWPLVGQAKAISGVDDLFDPATSDTVYDAIVQVANDYEITLVAALAAMRYYRERTCAIDTLLEANAAALR